MFPMLRAVVFFVLASLPICVFGQTKPELATGDEPYGDGSKIVQTIPSELLKVLDTTTAGRPIKTTLCESVKRPEGFDGKMVEFKATVGIGMEASVLLDDSCSANIWLSVGSKQPSGKLEYAYVNSLSDIVNPDRLDWRPLPPRQNVVLKRDRNYITFYKYLGKDFKSKEPHTLCVNCPLYRVSASFAGRLDHTDGKWKTFRGHDATLVPSSSGFGHLSGWDSQLVLQSVSEVAAKPIDPSVYGKKK